MFKIIFSIFFAFSLINAIDFKQENFKISNVTEDTAVINIGSLIIGQSGIVVHNFKNNQSIILTSASVTSTNEKTSTITFLHDDIIKQDSISNTNLNVANNDTFVLNHMYNVTLLISPNFQTYNNILKTHSNNFIDSELFSASLKINDNATPTKEDIQDFAKANNIATIYIAIKNKLYIIDSLTFKVIKVKHINIKDQSTQVPFYTKVLNIKNSFFDFTSLSQIEDYDKYYENMLKDN